MTTQQSLLTEDRIRDLENRLTQTTAERDQAVRDLNAAHAELNRMDFILQSGNDWLSTCIGDAAASSPGRTAGHTPTRRRGPQPRGGDWNWIQP